MLKKGLVQVYTGDGKGKTTAALGLAVRAAGQGNKVLIYQFLKPASLRLGERKAMVKLKGSIHIEALKVAWDMGKSHKDEPAVKGMRAAISEVIREIVTYARKKTYDVIILDEIVFCLACKLVSLEQVREVIEERDRRVEVVLTGRGASEELIGLADLVSEVRAVKHPYEKGEKPRRGIEF